MTETLSPQDAARLANSLRGWQRGYPQIPAKLRKILDPAADALDAAHAEIAQHDTALREAHEKQGTLREPDISKAWFRAAPSCQNALLGRLVRLEKELAEQLEP